MRRLLARLLPPLPLILPAIASGFFATLCFPPVSAWPLAFVALVPMLVALATARPSRANAFKTGFLFGVAFYLTLLWWVAKLIPTAGATIPWILVPALVVMSLYLSLYPALFALGVGWLSGYRVAALALAAPGLWVLIDVLRSSGELAFPWGALGYALSDIPSLTQSAAAFGMNGLTFLVVLVNVLVALAYVARRTTARVLAAACALVVVGAMWTHGKRELSRVDALVSATPDVARVAVAQPNVDLALKWKREYRDSTMLTIERLAEEAAGVGAKLIVFPETAAPFYIESSDRVYRERLHDLARGLGAHIFIGFLDHRYDGPGGALDVYNSSGLFSPDGALDKYDKNHLLPFGEQLPLSSRLRWLRKIDFGQANFQPGPKTRPIAMDGTAFTPLICFESVFSYLCRRGVREGSEMFVNITNDGWFGDTPGPFQHAQMAILRAVEFRRFLVRSANSGVSMIVDPAGRVAASLGLYRQGILVADVTLLDTETFYSRHGDVPLLVLCVALVVLGTVLGRRHRAFLPKR